MLGAAFMYHGFPKLFAGDGHQMFAGMLANLGIPAPGPMAWLVGILEFFGGIALILGILVRPTAALLIIDMLVAMFKVHLPNGFNFMHITGMTDAGPTFGMPGYEVNLLYIAGLLSLLLSGGGAFSQRRGRESRGAP
jgi:putative oxidoreductase